MSRARTNVLAPVVTSCFQMGGAARVSDKGERRTKAYSQGPGCRSHWISSSDKNTCDLEGYGAAEILVFL